jgi:hypothetical protein
MSLFRGNNFIHQHFSRGIQLVLCIIDAMFSGSSIEGHIFCIQAMVLDTPLMPSMPESVTTRNR